MDITINCENVQVSSAYGKKIAVTLEQIEIGDLNDSKIIETLDIETVIDTIGIDELLDYMGDDAISKYLIGKGYNITN